MGLTSWLVWFAILKCAEAPEAGGSISAIAASCITVMIASVWAYTSNETKRPSV